MGSATADRAGPASVHVTRYDEALEVYRSPHMARVADPLMATFREGTLSFLSRADHTNRRRILNRLLQRDGHTWYRDTALFPTVDHALADALCRPDPDGLCRVDVVDWSRRVFLQLAAAMVGLDAARTPEGAADLLRLVGTLEAAISRLAHMLGDRGDITERGTAAMREFAERFYEPACVVRRELVARCEQGLMQESELPHDLVTLVAAGADPDYRIEGVGLREAAALFNAGVNTSVSTLTDTVAELLTWFEAHPENEESGTDPTFMLGAFNETLRLHPVFPTASRRATRDLVLCGGTKVIAGQEVVLHVGRANRDRSVFGDAADAFDPRRSVPAGVYPYGLAFGSGPHMCYGIPLVLGNEGIDGSPVYLLRSLFGAGMARDPERSPGRQQSTTLEIWESFPIVLRPSRARGAHPDVSHGTC